MKTFILVIATIIVTAGAYAQTNTTITNKNQSENKQHSESKNQHQLEGFVYQRGQVIMVKEGRVARLENDTTLANGTVITGNGEFILKGGTKSLFNEGDRVDAWGNISSRNSSSHRQDNNYQSYSDGYLYYNGSIIQVNNGSMSSVYKDVTLRNGTHISCDGNYIRKGGTKMKLKDGDHMDLSGKVVSKNR